jgi:hypothetical protein
MSGWMIDNSDLARWEIAGRARPIKRLIRWERLL